MRFKPYGEKTRLDDSKRVQRVYQGKGINFIKNPEKPPLDLFHLSSEDKLEAEERGKEPLLSVWEATIERDALMENCSVDVPSKCNIYELEVQDIHKIKTQPGMTPVEAHYDPINKKDIRFGDLHAGIQGLYRKKGYLKADYKNIKDELVRLSLKIQ